MRARKVSLNIGRIPAGIPAGLRTREESLGRMPNAAGGTPALPFPNSL
jgi:hypothetical protein